MALEVIGSGLGRTGTKSLQSALDLLGFGPCYHMIEVFKNRERDAPLWIEAGASRPNWDAIFAGYRSAVDYPSAAYWRELAARYPDAKLVHTIRDPQSWVDSTQETIFRPDGVAMTQMKEGGVMGKFFNSFIEPALRGHLNDRDFLLGYFQRHTDEVKAAIPSDRLLVYDVREGWAPLCAFLGVAIPETPFPLQNTRAEFLAR